MKDNDEEVDTLAREDEEAEKYDVYKLKVKRSKIDHSITEEYSDEKFMYPPEIFSSSTPMQLKHALFSLHHALRGLTKTQRNGIYSELDDHAYIEKIIDDGTISLKLRKTPLKPLLESATRYFAIPLPLLHAYMVVTCITYHRTTFTLFCFLFYVCVLFIP